MSKHLERATKKALRRTNATILWVGLLTLIIGAIIGGGAYYFLSKDDGFTLVGEKNISVSLNSDYLYTDEGINAIILGKDYDGEVHIKTNLDKTDDGMYTLNTATSGEYYMIYTIDHPKFEKIQRVRVFTVGGDNNG